MYTITCRLFQPRVVGVEEISHLDTTYHLHISYYQARAGASSAIRIKHIEIKLDTR